MVRVSAAVVVLWTCAAFGQPAAQGPSPSKVLLQYIRDARKAGLKDAQIQNKAEKVGWPSAVVKEALAAVNGAPGAARPTVAAKAAPAQRPPEAVSVPKEVAPSSAKDVSAAAGGPASAEPAAGTGNPKKPTETTAPASVPETIKDRGADDDYEIGAGDVLQISVWKEPDASVQSTVVRPDGKISMPLLKQVLVLGLTVAQAEQLLTQELSKFITSPDVTVVIVGINSKKIYVTGGVKREGPITYSYRMTVLEALSEAGGLTEYAKRKRIYVLHRENGRQFLFPFDYDAVLKGERMELNRLLIPGDTIVVPH